MHADSLVPIVVECASFAFVILTMVLGQPSDRLLHVEALERLYEAIQRLLVELRRDLAVPKGDHAYLFPAAYVRQADGVEDFFRTERAREETRAKRMRIKGQFLSACFVSIVGATFSFMFSESLNNYDPSKGGAIPGIIYAASCFFPFLSIWFLWAPIAACHALRVENTILVGTLDRKIPASAKEDPQRRVDVGLIVAQEEDFHELMNGLNYIYEYDKVRKRHYYHFHMQAYSCVALMVGRGGEVPTAMATHTLLIKHQPEVVVMLGTSTALGEDLQVGDVFVPDQIDRYLENVVVKDSPVELAGFEFNLGGVAFRPHMELIEHVRHLRTAHPQRFHSWRQACSDRLRSNPVHSTLTSAGASPIRTEPEIRIGHLATGPAQSRSQAFARWLKSRKDHSYQVIGMETGGVAEVVHDAYDAERMIAVCGISNVLEKDDQELAGMSQREQQRLAMRNAIAFLKCMLEAELLPRADRPPKKGR